MSVTLYNGSTGLFDLLGKAFYAQGLINTSRGTTIPAAVIAILDKFEGLTNTADLAPIAAPVPGAITSYKSGATSTIRTLQQYCRELTIGMVNADTRLSRKDLPTALTELIRQMRAGSASVDQSTVTVAVTPGTNTGDAVLITSKKRGDGLLQENALADTITGTVTGTSDPTAALVTLTGTAAESDLLSSGWPLGSGARASLSLTPAASSLLANGDFEDEDDTDNAPDDWIVSVGTIGTGVLMTNVEIQTVVISGTPTGGTYTLSWANAAGKTQTTVELDYNASQSTVQSALNSLTGLESVTVVTTGTTPNFTHTITFTGRGGNVAQLTSTSRLTGGVPVITHATTSAGTSQVFAGGKSLRFVSDGATLTTINQRLTSLTALTAYAFSMWAMADVAPAAGVITIDLVDGVGGTVIADDQAVNNSFTFNASGLSASVWTHVSSLVAGGTECVFRMPAVVPALVYLRIRISTAVTNTRSVFLDNAALVEMQELGDGGAMIAGFSGANNVAEGDSWSIAVTNDRAGLLQEYCNRNFGMAAQGLLLPSNGAGAETVPDSVVA
jgi:hypothetical protein